MAGRPLHHRLRVRGWLKVCSPLHVGGLGHDPDVDLPVALDGKSRLYVPGTSLAGVCRHWMTGRRTDANALRELWGFTDNTDGRASRVFVRDGLVCAGPDIDAPFPVSRLDARTSVGIDRYTGAAAYGILFSRAVIPVGAFIRFELDVESGAADPADVGWLRDRARLAALLDALGHGEVRLGAAVTRGLGHVQLAHDVELEEHDLSNATGLIALLRGQPGRPGLDELDELDEPRGEPGLDLHPRLAVTIDWTPDAPVMVRADRAGVAVDTLPLTGAEGTDTVRLVLPGSSVKGALRSHAERILRTLEQRRAPRPVGDPITDATAFRAQLDQLHLAKVLFGAAPPAAQRDVHRSILEIPVDPARGIKELPDEQDERPDTPDKPIGAPGRQFSYGVGAVAVADCRSSQPLDGDLWRKMATEPDLGAMLTDSGKPEQDDQSYRQWLSAHGFDQADHVAIDRWTGGAADKLLFTILEPWQIGWEPIKLTVDIARLGDDANLSLALLMLVLRDLRDHRLPIGQGTTRGFGDITATVAVDTPDGTLDLDEYLASPAGELLRDTWTALWKEQAAA
ncbi:RAMP superfamily CRISPR-associated protein [Frankia sp. CiP3]|uniref:RAMP superfamily CRISPR-associated protein n=1 Tax=Frankia sp. CiP3 TaxID=2880971 RepID=UPI001EF49A6D|nr:RAMP superfamily CRISPR-associated protein [Frankia sp. CiP3]